MDADSFRAVLGRFASGVTVVTARAPDGHDQGMTVTSFCSLSLEPPLILVCIDHGAAMHDNLVAAQHFAVNILSSTQEPLSRRFSDPDPDRFEGIGFTRGRTGVSLLDDALAHLECRRFAEYPGGDHTIVVGEVLDASIRQDRPLLYYRSGYAQLER